MVLVLVIVFLDCLVEGSGVAIVGGGRLRLRFRELVLPLLAPSLPLFLLADLGAGEGDAVLFFVLCRLHL